MRNLLLTIVCLFLTCCSLKAQESDVVEEIFNIYDKLSKGSYHMTLLIKHNYLPVDSVNIKTVCSPVSCMYWHFRSTYKNLKDHSLREIYKFSEELQELELDNIKRKKEKYSCVSTYSADDVSAFKSSELFNIAIENILYQIHLADQLDNSLISDTAFVEILMEGLIPNDVGPIFDEAGWKFNEEKEQFMFAHILFDYGLITFVQDQSGTLIIYDSEKFKETFYNVKYNTDIDYWKKYKHLIK